MSAINDKAQAAAHIAAMSRKGRPVLSPQERAAVARKSNLDDAAFALKKAEIAVKSAAEKLDAAKAVYESAGKAYDDALAALTVKEGN